VAAADHALACPMHIHLFEPPCSIPLTVSTMSVSIDETIPSDAKPLAVPPINDPFHPKFHERQSSVCDEAQRLVQRKPGPWLLSAANSDSRSEPSRTRRTRGMGVWLSERLSPVRPWTAALVENQRRAWRPLSRAHAGRLPVLLQREPRVVRADVAGRLGARRSEPLVWRQSALLVASGTRCLPRVDGRGVGRAAPGFCDLGG
jgi:hypothetical protein